jgi:hypothetical protein
MGQTALRLCCYWPSHIPSSDLLGETPDAGHQARPGRAAEDENEKRQQNQSQS